MNDKISDIIESFRKSVITKRKELGLTQKDVADKTGIPRGTYAGLENGRLRFTMENLLMVSYVLDLNFFSRLMEEDDEKNIKNDDQHSVEIVVNEQSIANMIRDLNEMKEELKELKELKENQKAMMDFFMIKKNSIESSSDGEGVKKLEE